MLNFCYVRDYDKNVTSGLKGRQFRICIGVGLFIKPTLKSSPSNKMLPSLKSTHNLETINYFVIFWEALQFEAVVPQLHIFHMDLHLATHVQLKIQAIDV